MYNLRNFEDEVLDLQDLEVEVSEIEAFGSWLSVLCIVVGVSTVSIGC